MEVTQMVTDRKQDSDKTPVKQGPEKIPSAPNRIGPATPYDFDGKNLTAYGGLLPVGTLLEKLGFQQLVEETLKVKRQTRVMPAYRFILAMVLACYVGFSRLHHLRFLQREPMLTGILGVLRLPPQCTFWRFLASLHGSVAGQLLEVQRRLSNGQTDCGASADGFCRCAEDGENSAGSRRFWFLLLGRGRSL